MVSDGDWYSDSECKLLAETAKEAAHSLADYTRFVEVGVWRGRSASILDRFRGLHNLILVDDLSMDGADIAKWPPTAEYWLGKPEQRYWDGTQIALLHLDADHTKPVVLGHLELLGALLVPGGFIALHDYQGFSYPGVKQAWESWSGRERFKADSNVGSLVVFKANG